MAVAVEKPRFSVIVPAFNAAATVSAAVHSALSQTRTDLEVIVVDDGSADGTPDVVKRIADPRVSVLSQPNRGPSAARNTGAAAARGAYLSFLDSDDLWLPRYLELAAQALRDADDAGFAYTDAYAFDARTGKVRRRTAMARMRPPTPPPGDREAFLLELLERNFIYNSTTVPRAVFTATGGYDETKTTAEDYDLWLRIITGGYRATWIAGEQALYRLHAGQEMRNLAKMRQGLFAVYRDLDTARMPTPAHREALVRRRRETERGVGWAARAAAVVTPQGLVKSLKRAGIGESWYDRPPQDVARAFPDLTKP
jgi:glycosyltransferase involved in cell wall biosynthesis